MTETMWNRMPDEKMRPYRAALTLICSARDVEVEEYRRVLEECIRYRDRVRA